MVRFFCSFFQRLFRNTSDIIDVNDDATHRQLEREYWKKQIILMHVANWATAIATCVGILGFFLLVLQLNASREALIESQRAWIAPESPGFSPFPKTFGEVIQAIVNYSNIGNEPARNVRGYARMFWVRSVGPHHQLKIPHNDTCSTADKRSPAGTVWPDHDTKNTLSAEPEINQKRLTVDADYLMGKRVLFLQTCFAYETFGSMRHSAACWAFFPTISPDSGGVLTPIGGQWKNCPEVGQTFGD
jgi:hypothetical protein